MTRTATCIVCGEAFPVEKVKGRLPARCRTCLLRYNAERQQRWRMENPERSREIYAKNNAKRLADPEHRRAKREGEVRRRYGMEPEQWQALFARQHGLCAVCKKPPPTYFDEDGEYIKPQNLHVDHDHRTGAVRGLLCGNCNTMIGLAGENPAVLRSAIEYLQKE